MVINYSNSIQSLLRSPHRLRSTEKSNPTARREIPKLSPSIRTHAQQDWRLFEVQLVFEVKDESLRQIRHESPSSGRN